MTEAFFTMRVFAAALFDVAFAASAGCLLCHLWLVGSGGSAMERILRRWLAVCGAIMLIVVPLQMYLLAAGMTGDSSWSAAWVAMPDVAATHSGRAMLMSFGLVPFLFILSCISSAMRRRGGISIGIALAFGIAVCRAPIGHSGADGDFSFREFMQVLHISSIAVWAGGVLIAGFLVVPHFNAAGDPGRVVSFLRRLSRTVTLSLIAVSLSGFYSAWRGLDGSLTPIPHTAWGRTLALKILLVLIAFGHGARVRLLLKEQQGSQPGRIALSFHWLRWEAFLMLLVLLVSPLLANLPSPDM